MVAPAGFALSRAWRAAVVSVVPSAVSPAVLAFVAAAIRAGCDGIDQPLYAARIDSRRAFAPALAVSSVACSSAVPGDGLRVPVLEVGAVA